MTFTRGSVLLLFYCLLQPGPALSAPPVDFQKQIAPIFSAHCVRCHTPGNKKGEFSLSTIEDLKTNEYIVPKEPDESYLVELIISHQGKPPAMPKDSKPLTKKQVKLIKQWISQGADWPKEFVVREKSKADGSWWSLQPIKTTFVVGENSNPSIDDFIDRKLAEKNLKRNSPADRRTLIRRATFDLIGLPPTPEQVEAFVKDNDPKAYEKLIDRLLASKHYGERWGRHWLDVVRFGESNGFERNQVINSIWPFRDYVIRSINDDKPFHQFIREHLAGDVIGRDNPDIAVGSAFLVAGPYDDVGNQDPKQAAQIRANTLDEMINATGQAFLGITIGCARCHDHKFDPITQEDYYGMYATLAGIRHGAVPLATQEAREKRNKKLGPLNKRKSELEKSIKQTRAEILKRAHAKLPEYKKRWTRPKIDRRGTVETFEPVTAKFVRLVCDGQDVNPNVRNDFRIDEFEIYSADPRPRNVALASAGAKATGQARKIEDFPDAYSPSLAIDGKTGARFISTGDTLTIELAQPTAIDRVVFSSAKGESNPNHRKFLFVGEYHLEVSVDGKTWHEVAHGRDREPVKRVRDHRLFQYEITADDRKQLGEFQQELAKVKREIGKVPGLPSVFIGRRSANDAKGPFHVFVGGNPQKKGVKVTPASLDILSKKDLVGSYKLKAQLPEDQRRLALANWLVHPKNPLTPRVLANRLWHYHFGKGIVNTPNDFGYMGGRPTHPELLDFLAQQLTQNNWKIKKLHRLIMLSETYQQASTSRDDGLKIDGDSRLLWRFPPRRLSAEEIRDSMLQVSGKLDKKMGGPGFRLYHFMMDNVCTYVPLEKHGPETYRRAVYHQNARASVVDLMTEFDQPDCAFSTPRRARTTTPLQALTLLNHSFTLDMAQALADRIQKQAGEKADQQIQGVFLALYQRSASQHEVERCRAFVKKYDLRALCRAMFNSNEFLYVD